ncbi:MAG: hypothetical protein KDB53_21610, partial [Planctomycetes bacterium]|nr:hypothetical protein [Planctomycetota bacterium]
MLRRYAPEYQLTESVTRFGPVGIIAASLFQRFSENLPLTKLGDSLFNAIEEIGPRDDAHPGENYWGLRTFFDALYSDVEDHLRGRPARLPRRVSAASQSTSNDGAPKAAEPEDSGSEVRQALENRGL